MELYQITEKDIEEAKARLRVNLKLWILDNLRAVTEKNFDAQMGVVDGMERVYAWLLGGDVNNDADIKAAYAELNLRLYGKD